MFPSRGEYVVTVRGRISIAAVVMVAGLGALCYQALRERTPAPLRDAFKKCRFALLAVAVVSLFVNVLMLTVPLYMLQIYGRVLVSRMLAGRLKPIDHQSLEQRREPTVRLGPGNLDNPHAMFLATSAW